MKLITVHKQEEGQRLVKLLGAYLKEAPNSFFYKMLRKKNITLNGKKADGTEKLKCGDEIRLFLSQMRPTRNLLERCSRGKSSRWQN